jgi:hypothetical protein
MVVSTIWELYLWLLLLIVGYNDIRTGLTVILLAFSSRLQDGSLSSSHHICIQVETMGRSSIDSIFFIAC